MVGLTGQLPVGERVFQRRVFAQQRRRSFRPDPFGPGQPVRRIAAQRDEIRHLFGLDAIAFAHLGRADARHLAGAYGVQDQRPAGRELVGIAVAARNERMAAAPLLRRGCRCEEIVGLVTRRLGIGEAAGRDQFRQDVELLDQLLVELPAALIGRKQFLAVGRRAEGVPADQHRARPLAGIEVQQKVAEPDDCAAAAIALAADRFRQRVVGAVSQFRRTGPRSR